MAVFKLQILTPLEEFYNDDVDSITFDALLGRIQILANHSPYVSGIMPCVIRIEKDNSSRYGALSDGYIEFMENKASIFVNSAEWAEEIDLKRAKEALDRAETRIQSSEDNVDVKRASLALKRAEARIKAVELQGKHSGRNE